jgi:predicted nucleotidyltransferase
MSQTLQLGCTQVEEAKLADLCRRYGVRELSLFGSAVGNEMRPDSDLDLLVEFLPEAQVDLVSKNGLKPLIKTAVLEEARLLYAA